MGAHDFIEGEAGCPRCERLHRCSFQFDFRFPEYMETTSLRVGQWHAIEPAGTLAEVNDAGYVRVRAERPGPLVVIASDIYHFACECGAPLAVAAELAVNEARDQVSLLRARVLDVGRLLDAGAELQADYASEYNFLCPEGPAQSEAFLRGASYAVRQLCLRRAFARLFELPGSPGSPG